MSGWKNMTLNISGISDDSIVDGPGLRYTVFVQGCPHGCPGCHNPQTHSFDGGTKKTLASIMDEIRANPLLYGVTFSGGEPFCQADVLAVLGRQIREAGYSLMTYTGYTYEELLGMAEHDRGVRDLLEETDILVDGRFLIEQRDLELVFRGSRNQRLIDLAAMRRSGDAGRVIEWRPQ